MSDEDKTFSGSFVLDLRIWWRQAHTLYYVANLREQDGGHLTGVGNFIGIMLITTFV